MLPEAHRQGADMRAIVLGAIAACIFTSSANAQTALARIEAACGDEFRQLKKPEGQWEAFFKECAARKRANPVDLPQVNSGPQPSFNCATAKTASARLICSDAELSNADGALGKAFQGAVRSLEGKEKAAKIEEQVKWIRAMPARWQAGCADRRTSFIEAMHARSNKCEGERIFGCGTTSTDNY